MNPSSMFFRIAASLVLAAVSLPSPAAEPDLGPVETLTGLVVETVPLGKIFDHLAAADPTWPGQGVLDQITAAQLACLRVKLSSAGYLRYAEARVAEYVATDPSRVEGDIAVLDGGVAELLGKLVLAGAEGERTGVEVDTDAVLADATPEQMNAFLRFFSEGEFAPLRELAGVGEALDPKASEEANEAAGEQQGEALAVQVMSAAIDTCGVELPDAG